MTSSTSGQWGGLALTDMPIEILNNIANRLERKHCLINFMKASRQCRVVAEPIVYQDWIEEKEYRNGNADIYLFLRTMISRPDLAKHVKAFTGLGTGYQEEWEEISEAWRSVKDNVFNASEWEQLEAIIKSKWRDHEQPKVLARLRGGEWEPAITIMFSLLSNLQELSLGGWYSSCAILDGYIRQASLCQHGCESSLDLSSALPKLSSVSLSFHDTEGSMNPEELEAWRKLKSMRVLIGHMVGTDNGDGPDSEFDDGKVPRTEEQSGCLVEKLVLTYSAIDANQLADSLYLFPHLKHFEYSFGGAIVSHGSMEPPKLRRALLEVKDTLEYLRLTDEDGGRYEELSEYPLGSLKDFTKLKTLITDAATLLGTITPDSDQSAFSTHGYPPYVSLVDTLPFNLERLELTACSNSSTASYLMDLARKIRLFPNLKEMDLDIFYVNDSGYGMTTGVDTGSEGFSDEDSATFRRLCKEAGVKLKSFGWTLNSSGGIDETDDENYV